MANETERTGPNRRTALRTMAAGVGAAASALWVSELSLLAEEQAVHAHLLAATPQGGTWTPAVLSPEQLETVGTLVELIIPTTDTPGAKAALVDRYIDGVLRTANPDTRTRFLEGLAWMDTRSTALFNTRLDAATPAQQTDLLTRLAALPSSEAETGVQFFTALKSMTITGYYTTEIGLRQELGDSGVLMLPSYPGCTHPEHQ
ncbi:MAG: gluconate 2-dehydrogenase subunit 3 family protein [Acidobacteria bacterium]|nr:gluconate 2-dehydrogenase subunit 3 family protein [Acidobacteriota bacterium]